LEVAGCVGLLGGGWWGGDVVALECDGFGGYDVFCWRWGRGCGGWRCRGGSLSGWRRRRGGCGAGVAETEYAAASDVGEASLPYEQIHVRVSEHEFVFF
jgi:hypothetical protein